MASLHAPAGDGGDAVAALDLLRLNNAAASKQIKESGGLSMLDGLRQYGTAAR